jgi:uncharacterized protein YfaS (alpha-2-macroglobulin family)
MKKFVTATFLAVMLVTLTVSVAFANYGDDNKLSGSIKEKGTLKAIAGSKVKLYKTSGKKVDSDKTGKNGKYKFKELTEREYKVSATAVGYRNPKNAKASVSAKVDVDGSTTKSLYFVKI